MLEKINKITTVKAALIIAVLGLAVFSIGLKNAFQGDDYLQIVNNIPVHSITNVRLFFEGGTFYNGQGLAPLTGVSYRPLMTTTFSLIYTLFGAHPIYFHLFQLFLYISSAILLYLILGRILKPVFALFLSVVFLVHPLNSQVVFAIPSMQDALFFFFGILALWILIQFSSVKSLLLVAVCLFLSMLSKETAIVFIAITLLYLLWFDRKRLFTFIGIMVIPIGLYMALRINAVGLNTRESIGPIDNVNLAARLFTAPSIVLFYITKFIFPWKLASAYHWVYPSFSFRHVLLPLVIDLAVVGGFVYMGVQLHSRVKKDIYYIYLFFAVWAIVGLLPYLQVIPLDMTACESWFYFSIVGVLGMIGILIENFKPRIEPLWVFVIAALIVGALGFRTMYRGLDWRSEYSLAVTDVSVSKEDFNAYLNIAIHYTQLGNYTQAEQYAQKSINIYPTAISYNALGGSLVVLGDYPGAYQAYTEGLKYGDDYALYDGLSLVSAFYGNPAVNQQLLIKATHLFPQDPNPWFFLAILDYRGQDNYDARLAIVNAYKYGQSNPKISGTVAVVYDRIMNNKPLGSIFSSGH